MMREIQTEAYTIMHTWKAKWVNVTQDAVMDVCASGKVTGKIPLLKGVVITVEGPI